MTNIKYDYVQIWEAGDVACKWLRLFVTLWDVSGTIIRSFVICASVQVVQFWQPGDVACKWLRLFVTQWDVSGAII